MSQTVVKFKCSVVESARLCRNSMRPKGAAFLLPKKTPAAVATLTFLRCLGMVFWCGAVVVTDTKLPVRLGRRQDGKEVGSDLFEFLLACVSLALQQM